MDELVRLVASKAGLPEAQARTAVTTVLDFLKHKLPAPVASQLEAVVGGGQAASVADNVLKGVGAALDQMKSKKG
jgi:hypothetical protein